MISRGVEISIAGGGGEMVRAEERWFVRRRDGSCLSLGRNQAPYIGIFRQP